MRRPLFSDSCRRSRASGWCRGGVVFRSPSCFWSLWLIRPRAERTVLACSTSGRSRSQAICQGASRVSLSWRSARALGSAPRPVGGWRGGCAADVAVGLIAPARSPAAGRGALHRRHGGLKTPGLRRGRVRGELLNCANATPKPSAGTGRASASRAKRRTRPPTAGSCCARTRCPGATAAPPSCACFPTSPRSGARASCSPSTATPRIAPRASSRSANSPPRSRTSSTNRSRRLPPTTTAACACCNRATPTAASCSRRCTSAATRQSAPARSSSG